MIRIGISEEKIILSQQSNIVQTTKIEETINLCANNYLGLANHPDVRKTDAEAGHTRGSSR